MKSNDEIFHKLDSWRKLPNYQLERRADIFFSLYLKEVLELKTSEVIMNTIIPEFPIRVGSIYSDRASNKSFKIDYVCFNKDLSKTYFIELKTDISSRREEQDDYLKAAQKVGLKNLSQGILEIFRATNSKRKYYQLLLLMENVGLISIPEEFNEKMQLDNMSGIVELSRKIKITAKKSKCEIIYIQPIGDKPNIINFKEYSKIVSKHNDEMSKRFSKSLIEWQV